MHGHDGIPFLLRHCCKALVTENASVGDEDVHAAELLDRDLHKRIAVFRRSDGGGGFATSYAMSSSLSTIAARQKWNGGLTFGDLINDCAGTLLTHVVHHDVRTEAGEQESVRTAQTRTRTSDDGGFAVIANRRLELLVIRQLLRLLQCALGKLE
jgi:hypothetical protein